MTDSSVVSHPALQMVPERSQALLDLFTVHKIRYRENEDPGDYDCFADLKRREISVGCDFAAVLFAHCYAFSVIFFAAQRCYQGRNTPLRSLPEHELVKVRDATRLWQHAQVALISGKAFQIPLDHPLASLDATSLEVVLANDLTTMGLGWTELHELYHILFYLQVENSGQTFSAVAEEHQADAFASRWCLQHYEEFAIQYGPMSDNVFIKRCMAIASVLSLIGCVEGSHPGSSGSQHPNPFERILTFLSAFSPEAAGPNSDRNASAWWFVAMAFHHFAKNANDGRQAPMDRVYDTPGEFLRAQLDLLSPEWQALSLTMPEPGAPRDALFGALENQECGSGLPDHVTLRAAIVQLADTASVTNRTPGCSLMTINVVNGAITKGQQSACWASLLRPGQIFLLFLAGGLAMASAATALAPFAAALLAFKYVEAARTRIDADLAIAYLSLWSAADNANRLYIALAHEKINAMRVYWKLAPATIGDTNRWIAHLIELGAIHRSQLEPHAYKLVEKVIWKIRPIANSLT